jgi:hypothetical protein
MAAQQAHKGVTITENNAYETLLDILTDNELIADPEISACMGFLGGEAISKVSAVNKIQKQLDTYYASSQLLVSPVQVLELAESLKL